MPRSDRVDAFLVWARPQREQITSLLAAYRSRLTHADRPLTRDKVELTLDTIAGLEGLLAGLDRLLVRHQGPPKNP
jgi:hypothetical protein